jgi:hypothetical protein
MAKKSTTITDPDLAKVGVALQRAAANARQLGFATNTPVYVYRDGKIVDIVAEHRATQTPKKPAKKNLQRKTTSHPRKAASNKTR